MDPGLGRRYRRAGRFSAHDCKFTPGRPAESRGAGAPVAATACRGLSSNPASVQTPLAEYVGQYIAGRTAVRTPAGITGRATKQRISRT